MYSLPKGVLSFAIRASIDFLPTLSNLYKWGKRSTDLCKLCGGKETLQHVLNSCPKALEQGRFTWRHNCILNEIIKLIKENRNIETLHADLPGYSTAGGTIPSNIIVTSCKPDIVVINQKSIEICELTVPLEPNIVKAHGRKCNKYDKLARDIRSKGYTCKLICFEIGSRGLICPDNEIRIKNMLKMNGKEFRKICYTIWNAKYNQVWENVSFA